MTLGGLSATAMAADLTGYLATYRVSADGKTGTATRTLTKTG
ncbi:DUF3108 domain-containing protein, partial [Moraxella catarrhalis]|nr:DUF3108 domain-containing protein [Moraxella catarrhalis]